MKIERTEHNQIKITREDGGFIQSQSVENNILFAILETLEEIKCGIIGVSSAINDDTYRSITAKDKS